MYLNETGIMFKTIIVTEQLTHKAIREITANCIFILDLQVAGYRTLNCETGVPINNMLEAKVVFV